MGVEEHAAAAEQVVERTTYPDGRVVERIIRRDVVTAKRSSANEAVGRLRSGPAVKNFPAPTGRSHFWYITTDDVDYLYAGLRQRLDRGLHSQWQWTVAGSGESPGTWVR